MAPLIIATLGPASESAEAMASLLNAGADAFRLNLSHAAAAWGETVCQTLAGLLPPGAPLPLVADLPGRKKRTGPLPTPVDLRAGEEVFLGKEAPAGCSGRFLPLDLEEGSFDGLRPSRILLRDGRIVLAVEERADGPSRGFRCRVERPGQAVGRMGVAMEGTAFTAALDTVPDALPPLLQRGVSRLMLSFCERGEDVEAAARLCAGLGANAVAPMPKIETPEALANLDELLAAADSFCLARGDLGTRLAPRALWEAETRLLDSAARAGKKVLVAGEVMMGVFGLGRPSRADMAGAAYALERGAAGFILSDETAVGPDPAGAVQALRSLCG